MREDKKLRGDLDWSALKEVQLVKRVEKVFQQDMRYMNLKTDSWNDQGK